MSQKKYIKNLDGLQIPIDFTNKDKLKSSCDIPSTVADRPSSSLRAESLWVTMSNGEQLHLKHIFSKKELEKKRNKIGIFMLHGESESGNIFFNNKSSNLASRLASEGYDVFVADLPGRGRSLGSNDGYADSTIHKIVTEGIPKLISRIKDILSTKQLETTTQYKAKMIWIAHGFNSCLLTAAWSRLDEKKKSNIYMVFFSARRKLISKNIASRIIKFIFRQKLTSILLKYHGKFPAKKIRFGSCDENLDWYHVYNNWINSDSWIDTVDLFDYKKSLKINPIPSSLYFSCAVESFFGGIVDTRHFINDQGFHDARIFVLDKKYNCRSMLANNSAIDVIFQKLIFWLKERYVYPDCEFNQDSLVDETSLLDKPGVLIS